MMAFHDVVEALKNLSIDQKQEITVLLQQYIREERREEIYENLQLVQEEQKQGKLNFSSDINELRQMIEE